MALWRYAKQREHVKSIDRLAYIVQGIFGRVSKMFCAIIEEVSKASSNCLGYHMEVRNGEIVKAIMREI